MPQTFCILGLGYIGLPTAALLANSGANVIGVDIDPRVVDAVNRGETPFPERELDNLVRRTVRSGALRAMTQPVPADAFIITVPTPLTTDRQADLSHVLAAMEAIAPVVKPDDMIILESTVPVGSLKRLALELGRVRPDLHIAPDGKCEGRVSMAYCPERTFPGAVVHELIANDRVIGGLTPACAARAALVYERFVRGRFSLTDSQTAEMVKLSENTFRDVNIAFANELSVICGGLNVDVREVIDLANQHPRVNILNPGPGVGGHCVAVDPWFLHEANPEAARLIRQARAVNDGMPARIVQIVEEAIRGLTSPTIACLGLSYKADVADMRESPALEIVQLLAERSVAHLLVAEPHIDALPTGLHGANVEFTTAEAAIMRSDLVLLLVDHSAFLGCRKAASARRLIDTRGFWR